MLAWLAARAQQPTAITVVFDAYSKKAPHARLTEINERGIHVVFAGGYSSADDYIAEYLRGHSHPKQLTVVSNDREVRRAARRRKAKAMACEEFERQLDRGKRRRTAQGTSKMKQGEVSEEEQRFWQRVFDDRIPGEAGPAADGLDDFHQAMRSLEEPPDPKL